MDLYNKKELTKNEKIIKKIALALEAQNEAKMWRKKYYEAVKGLHTCTDCGKVICADCQYSCICDNMFCNRCLNYCSENCYVKVCNDCGPRCNEHRPKPQMEKVE